MGEKTSARKKDGERAREKKNLHLYLYIIDIQREYA